MGGSPSNPGQQTTSGKGREVPVGQVWGPLVPWQGVVDLVNNYPLSFSLAALARLRPLGRAKIRETTTLRRTLPDPLCSRRRPGYHLRIGSLGPFPRRRVSGWQRRRRGRLRLGRVSRTRTVTLSTLRKPEPIEDLIAWLIRDLRLVLTFLLGGLIPGYRNTSATTC